MTEGGKAFIEALGKPDPAVPNGLQFQSSGRQVVWEMFHREIGSGWFRDGFLYLFGEGLEALRPCLDAWSFLVPPCEDRMIIGKNAYGMILVLDHGHDAEKEHVYLLDPFTVTYGTADNIQFANTIGRALPKNEFPGFLDDSAYRQWLVENDVERLLFENVLGFKVPRGLGGKIETSNLQLDGIVDYYRTTAPIYAEAFATLQAK